MKSRSDADKHTAEQIFNSFIEGEQAYDGITDNPVRAIISKFVEAKSGIESNGSQQNTEANVALYLVCKYAGTKKRHVETLIKSYDADPDYVLEGNTGDSPLHLVASRCDSLGAVIALLEAGADVNRVNKRGTSFMYPVCHFVLHALF
jgi:ankyrin repeat protein